MKTPDLVTCKSFIFHFVLEIEHVWTFFGDVFKAKSLLTRDSAIKLFFSSTIPSFLHIITRKRNAEILSTQDRPAWKRQFDHTCEITHLDTCALSCHASLLHKKLI